MKFFENKRSALSGLLILFFFFLLSSQAFAGSEAKANVTENDLNALWVLVAAGLVFLMQAGFQCLEVGLVRPQHAKTVAMKNMIDWIICSLAFFVMGFGFMFGKSDLGILGLSDFFPSSFHVEGGHELGVVFFLFQLTFVGTAATIVSGAMSERTGFIPYMTASIFMSLLIYPFFGHWAWGNVFYESNSAWLADLGFIDFAGSTVVHSTGAWVSLIGLILLGPRLGRFDKDGKPRDFKPSNFAYSAFGVLLLWLGWWGFNGGSTLSTGVSVSHIILNTNLAGGTAGLVAFFHCFLFQKKDGIYEKLIGGVLGGLVAITASANMQTHGTAILIGALAGLVHNWSYDILLKKWKIDDAVGAIPVHGFCGVLGTLAVVLAPAEALAHSRFIQLGIQLIGIVTCFAWSMGIGYLMFITLKKSVGLRVSPQEERDGISLYPNLKDDENHQDEDVDEDELNKLLELMKE